MSAAFASEFPVRFAHCDAAGIVFFPRYFELCDAAVEDWTEFVLGVTRKSMHLEQGLGLPAVQLQTSFLAPSELGDRLQISVSLAGLGNSSALLKLEGSVAGIKRFETKLKIVLMNLKERRSLAWPQPWRERLINKLEETQV